MIHLKIDVKNKILDDTQTFNISNQPYERKHIFLLKVEMVLNETSQQWLSQQMEPPNVSYITYRLDRYRQINQMETNGSHSQLRGSVIPCLADERKISSPISSIMAIIFLQLQLF